MNGKECVAMVLAGGRGDRLGALTHYYPKPAVYFGNQHRIIDFTLKNCENAGIETIGILSQYFSSDLHAYIKTAYAWETKRGGIHMLPSKSGAHAYQGTADAVYKNIAFIERFRPACVLVLAGDHIYSMDYRKMIDFHMKNGADVTVASTSVPIQDASRFGILSADMSGRVHCFEEKPPFPKSNLASMGIYVFRWDMLKQYLLADGKAPQTRHDFGKDILPAMLRGNAAMYTYKFNGYWRDVGTVRSLWEANMDRLDGVYGLPPRGGRPCAESAPREAARIEPGGRSVISPGCSVFGQVEHSVLGPGVTVGKGAELIDCVVMPGVYIGENVRLYRTVVGTRAIIMDNTVIGTENGTDLCIDCKICTGGVSLVAPWLHIAEGMRFQGGSHIDKERLSALCVPARADTRPRRERKAFRRFEQPDRRIRPAAADF